MKSNSIKKVILSIVVLPTLSIPAVKANDTTLNKEIIAEYQPMFTDGKSWVLWHGDPSWQYFDENPYSTHEMIYVDVVGDTEIEGIPCKLVKIEIDEKESGCQWCKSHTLNSKILYVCVYEKNRKIFVYRNPGPYYVENGDEYYVAYGDPYFDVYMDTNFTAGDYSSKFGHITEDKILNIDGRSYRTLTTDSYIGDWEEPTMWIEGIGANYFPNSADLFMEKYSTEYQTNMICSIACSYLVRCSEKGKTLYDKSKELSNLGMQLYLKDDIHTSVSTLNGIVTTNNTFYNLQGIKVINPQKGQFYILNNKVIKY